MKLTVLPLSPNKINDFRNLFLNQKAALLVHKDLNLIEDVSADEVDIAQSLIINEMAERLSLREKATFSKVNDALQRIENGSFGICEECEEPITEKRLQAVPYCTTCISCAEQQERTAKQYNKKG